MTISRVENACKPLILLGLQKNIKIISTHLLTVLELCVILHIEQRRGTEKRVPIRVPDINNNKPIKIDRN